MVLIVITMMTVTLVIKPVFDNDGADCVDDKRELKQPRRRRQQERYKFAYLTMKNNSFACAYFIFGHFADVFVLSTT